MRDIFWASFCFWFTLFGLYIFNIPAPFVKYWIQNNTEQALEWILEVKNDNNT